MGRFLIVCGSSLTPLPRNVPEYGKKQISTPSFHIYGDADNICLPHLSERLIRQYQESSFYVHSGGHHFPDGDASDDVWQQLRDFLRQFQEVQTWQPKNKLAA